MAALFFVGCGAPGDCGGHAAAAYELVEMRAREGGHLGAVGVGVVDEPLEGCGFLGFGAVLADSVLQSASGTAFEELGGRRGPHLVPGAGRHQGV